MRHTKLILTEGQTDAAILKTILPEEITSKIKIIQSGGHSSTLSIARTLLLDDKYQLAIVLDSDSTDGVEMKSFIDSYLGKSNQGKYQLFIFSPYIESLLIKNKETLESALGRKLTEKEWIKAISSPKTYLTKNLKSNEPLIKKSTFKKNPIVKKLVEYLAAA